MAGSVLLIVVFEREHRVLLNQCLKSTPHRLIFAADGEDGFDRFSEVKPDLVMAHVDAPRLDGALLCGLVRQQPGGDAVPFLLLGEDLADPASARRRARAAGADGALALPCERAVLVETLERFLRDGRAASDLGAESEEVAISDPPPEPEPGPAPESKPADGARPWTDIEITLDEEQRPAELASLPAEDEEEGIPSITHASDLLIEAPRPAPAPPTIPQPVASEPPRPAPPPRASSVLPSRAPAPRAPSRVRSPIHADLDPDLAAAAMAPAAGLLEELPLPSRPRPGGGRLQHSDPLIREIPRDATPTGGAPRPAEDVGAGPGAGGRGLDESRLGKRLTKRVRTISAALDELDYYQLLGTDPAAGDKAIRDAYFELSLEFHPDRFFLLRSGDLKEKIYAIYRRVNEAYGVLSDRRRRAFYDDALASGFKRLPPESRGLRPENDGPPRLDAPTQHPQASRFVALAQVALDGGDWNGARMYLSLASVYEPGNTRLDRATAEVARMRARPGQTVLHPD